MNMVLAEIAEKDYPIEVKQIIDIFKELNKTGQTIIMVTHEEEYARVAKRIVKIDDGLIVN